MIVLILEWSQCSNTPLSAGSTSCSALQHDQHYTARGVIAMKNQSRNFDKSLLAEIIAILKHQPRVHEKESKSPFLFNKSERKGPQRLLWFYGAMLSRYQIRHSSWKVICQLTTGTPMRFSYHGYCFTSTWSRRCLQLLWAPLVYFQLISQYRSSFLIWMFLEKNHVFWSFNVVIYYTMGLNDREKSYWLSNLSPTSSTTLK